MISTIGYLAITILIGLILLFKGKRYFKPIIVFLTFFIVYNIYTVYGGTGTKDITIGALAGVVGALLVFFVTKIAFFFAGAMAGSALASIVISYLPDEYIKFKPLVSIVIILLIGALTIKLKDVLIVICTSAVGAYLSGVTVTYTVLNYNKLDTLQTVSKNIFEVIREMNIIIFKDFVNFQSAKMIIVVLILFCFGLLVQFGVFRKLTR